MGEVTEFARFVEDQLPRLRSYVARLPGVPQADVEDLLQEALLRAFQARDRFDSDTHAVNWICQVVRNLLVDAHRRWLRRPVMLHGDLDDVGSHAPDPADLVVAAEQATLVIHAFAQLTQSQRDLLWEHVVEGVSYAEIARRTATPLATVRSLAHRARLAAVREFAQASGALSVLPALALRPWRRFAQKAAGVPPNAVDAMAVAGAIVIAIALPVAPTLPSDSNAVADGVAPHPQVVTAASTPLAPLRTATAATTPTKVWPARGTAAVPTGATRVTDPSELVRAVQTGTYSGTYSSDCTFTPKTTTPVLDTYDCTFSTVSSICRIKLHGATTATGCTIELLPTDVSGDATGADGFGFGSPARHCWNGGRGTGRLRFRVSPLAETFDLPVLLLMDESQLDVISENVKVLGLSGSFPFSCVVSHQQNQVGFHGTLGY